MNGFVVGTRFFEKDARESENSLLVLEKFCFKALAAGAEHVFVAVNEEQDVSGVLQKKARDGVTIFSVKPWGHFVQPLNALLLMGRKYWCRGFYFLSASTTVALTRDIADMLSRHMDRKTLVVGAAMEGHLFEAGGPHEDWHKAGRYVPWNTLALWNADMLYSYGGFSLLGDGPPAEPENAGVEEAVTITSVQALFARVHDTDAAYAKLVAVPGVLWDTSGFSGERLAEHEKKMASKSERATIQLVYSGLPEPAVFHLI